ncbi:flavodoxin family protein [bacterium]|nr:MAG: flavodoxin family protein [bacterium]
MTRYLFVTAHPEPQSFNHAMTNEATRHLRSQGFEVKHSDLYGMGWQPVSDRRNFTSISDPHYLKQQVEEVYATDHDTFAPDIAAEIEKLFWCDVLVLQFPLWWFGMPGILKGWVDRVFAMSKTYGWGEWYDAGKFRGKRAMVSLTTGAPEGMFGDGGMNPAMETILVPIHHGIFKFTGFEVLPPFIAWEVAHISQEARGEYLEKYSQVLAQL